jgi:hypothetical protein
MILSISESIFNHPNFDFELVNSFSEVRMEKQKNVRTILFMPTDQLEVFLPNSNRISELSSEIINSLKNLGSTTIHIIHCCIPKNENLTLFFQESLKGLFRYSISQQRGNILNSVASFEFNNQEDFDFRESLTTIKSQGFEVLCEGSYLAAPFRPKYLDLSLSRWQQIVVELESELEENLILGPIVHPEANNFNDNLVRGLAQAVKISKEG